MITSAAFSPARGAPGGARPDPNDSCPAGNPALRLSVPKVPRRRTPTSATCRSGVIADGAPKARGTDRIARIKPVAPRTGVQEPANACDHPRYICIHGHFYQPPRENPWLDVVEVEDSAAPFHDWNERITRECYAPNTRARLLDREGRIIHLLNNYAWISFNFGPTLLHWMAEHAPEVHQGIVEADRLEPGAARRARQCPRPGIQPHDHAAGQPARQGDAGRLGHRRLPPSVRPRARGDVAGGDGRRHRDAGGAGRGRHPVHDPGAAAGAAVAQAGRRRSGRRSPAGIDPSRAYLCRLPSGRSIVLFFWTPSSRTRSPSSGCSMTASGSSTGCQQGFDDRREHAQLMHIATDGESYGHHHAHGDMALAYALDRLADDPDVRLTNYGEFLELHPPEWEVEIHENSSWSCVHGIERWRSDCGCRMRGDWDQRWRGAAPPRARRAQSRSSTTSSARADASASPIPGPPATPTSRSSSNRDRDESSARSWRSHGHPDLDRAQVTDALRLLEMQHDAMLMFTSCGWFHDEISGIETTQCLQYAARAIHLAKQFHRDFEESFVADLEEAPSNVARYRRWARSLGAARAAERGRPRARAGAPRHQPDLSSPAGEAARQRVYSFDSRDARPGGADSGRRPPGGRPAARPVAADLEPGRGPVRGDPFRRPRLPRRARVKSRSASPSAVRVVQEATAARPIAPDRSPT